MKVSGPGRIDPSQAGKAKSAQAAPGFRVDMGAGAAAPRATMAAAGVSSLDAILALQTVPSATERKKRAVKRANNLLDLMGDVRVGLLDGDIPIAQVDKLKRATQAARDEVDDPNLSGVLDEIDLRARVELAKLGIYD
jgi:hypothetical protein